MLLPRHKEALTNIKQLFQDASYNLSFKMLNVADFGIAQDRKRVFFVGYRSNLKKKFDFHLSTDKNVSLRDTIYDLKDNVLPAKDGNRTNGNLCLIPNHEYMTGGFSSIFMSRNRVRGWDEVSYTIQAGGRHAPLHPQAPKMTLIQQNKRAFDKKYEHLYRRLSVRECARIQTFPDDFIFEYENIAHAYKMIGNAVPVKMAQILAEKIYTDMIY